MAGYETRTFEFACGPCRLRVLALSDLQQFSDPHGTAERAGISSAQWSLFGHPWPAGKVLASRMLDVDVRGIRILELGCGLGLASLVLASRGADITASDYHPLAAEFLERNVVANDLPAVPFRLLDWTRPDPGLGLFDMIVGSDILYERGHADLLGEVIERHAGVHAKVMLTDPGRHHAGRFVRGLKARGFAVTEEHTAFEEGERPPFRGRVVTAVR